MQASASLSPPEDLVSVCSEGKCSEKTCSECCEEVRCEEKTCPDACYGFIDCDDADACTKPDCAQMTDLCRDVAPPCFELDCVQRLTNEDMPAAARLASTTLFAQPEHPNPGLDDFADQGLMGLAGGHYGPFDLGHPTWSPLPNTHLLYPFVRPSAPSDQDDFSPAAGGMHAFSPSSTEGPLKAGNLRPIQDDTTPGDGCAIQCQWGNSCDGIFPDWSTLDDHVYRAHVKPQNEIRCQWDNCRQATDPNELMGHLNSLHAHDWSSAHYEPQPQVQACHWFQCTSTFPDGAAGLEDHVRSSHVPLDLPPLHCQWDSCGAVADDPADLSLHLQMDHFSDLISSAPLGGGAAETFAAAAAATETEAALLGAERATSGRCTCQWQVDDLTSDEGKRPCGLPFADAAALQSHIKETHINQFTKKAHFVCQWHGCPRCGQQPFAQRSKLERHLQVHTGFKSHRCETCGQDFSGLLALQQHQRRHTGEKPYRCDICGRLFAQSTALIMHTRTHTKERPLKCDFPGCHKTFGESSTLSKHKRTHNAVGYHICRHPGCDSSFHRLDQLKRHDTLVHGGRLRDSLAPLRPTPTPTHDLSR
ncbi:MAG: zinc-finger protein [Phylliscum demangeonii]|nr:MAG: zinc-finger protein [Phylliscum demangeonii]